jgi:hypothetical protein
MNDRVRTRLCEILQHLKRQGDTTINYKKVKGLLLDLCGEHRTEINILVLAIAEGFVKRLVECPAIPAAIRVKSAASNFTRDFAVPDAVALWAINSWALALKIIDTEIPADPPQVPGQRPPNARQSNLGIAALAKPASLSANPPQNWPAATVVVSRFGYGDYKSLEQAINDNENDVSILIKRGTYTPKSLFCGKKRVYIIKDSADGEVIIQDTFIFLDGGNLSVNQCTLQNVRVGGALRVHNQYRGNVLFSSCQGVAASFDKIDSVELLDCSFHGGLHLDAKKGVVQHSSVIGEKFLVSGGIHLSACAVRTKVLGVMGGSVLFESSEIGTGEGAITFRAENVCLRDCNVTCGVGGIEVDEDGGLVLSKCRLSSAPSQRIARLIRVTGYGVVKCSETEFFGAETGVDVQVGSAEMENCKFYDNDVAIRFASESAGKIEDCDLQSNRIPYDIDAAADVQLVDNLV